MGTNPAFDPWRLPPSDRCWWCGAPATSEEHRIKHSTLRRVARNDDGTVDAANVFKKSDDYEGLLRSIRKGSQVRWRKNLCSHCNNARSQPFDLAYDKFEDFLVDHADLVMRWEKLRWTDVYGPSGQDGARNLARYFGKQLGCMLASQRLPVPTELVAFLDGAESCPSIGFRTCRNWRGAYAHRRMRRHGHEGLTTFVGLLDSEGYARDGRFSGVSYGYHIGYVWVLADWREGTVQQSWFQQPSAEFPLVNGSLRDRMHWVPFVYLNEARNWWLRIRGSNSLS